MGNIASLFVVRVKQPIKLRAESNDRKWKKHARIHKHTKKDHGSEQEREQKKYCVEFFFFRENKFTTFIQKIKFISDFVVNGNELPKQS